MCPDSRSFFFFQAEDGIRDYKVTGVQTCALPIFTRGPLGRFAEGAQVMLEQIRALMRAPVVLAWTSTLTLLIFVAGGAQVWLVLDFIGGAAGRGRGGRSGGAGSLKKKKK